jgi:hypothetical protein
MPSTSSTRGRMSSPQEQPRTRPAIRRRDSNDN